MFCNRKPTAEWHARCTHPPLNIGHAAHSPAQAAVFCNRKPAAEWLARRLTAAGYPAAHLSGDLPQTERMEAMDAVRNFRLRVIVSTDVMARGVDLDRVNLVANLDLPPDAATYVHRVGRTGRFGSKGVAVALVTQWELQKLQGYLAAVGGGGWALGGAWCPCCAWCLWHGAWLGHGAWLWHGVMLCPSLYDERIMGARGALTIRA